MKLGRIIGKKNDKQLEGGRLDTIPHQAYHGIRSSCNLVRSKLRPRACNGKKKMSFKETI